ncbi:MAG: nitroreductase family protein, partial [Oscillospiraceae bacterium]
SENVITKCGLAFEIENYCTATENIILGATALGYETVWTDGMTRSPQVNEKVREILSIPSEKTIRAILPIGVPKEQGTQAPKDGIEKMVTFID